MYATLKSLSLFIINMWLCVCVFMSMRTSMSVAKVKFVCELNGAT